SSADDAPWVVLGWRPAGQLEEVRVAGQSPFPDEVSHRRVGTIDGITQDRDESHTRDDIRDSPRHLSGTVAPHHVARSGLADDGLTRPTRKLCPVPIQSACIKPLGRVEEHGLGGRRVHVGMTSGVDSQPARPALLRPNDEEFRKRNFGTRHDPYGPRSPPASDRDTIYLSRSGTGRAPDRDIAADHLLELSETVTEVTIECPP